MPKQRDSNRYVILPLHGLRAEGLKESKESREFLLDAYGKFKSSVANKSTVLGQGVSMRSSVSPTVKLRVLDSIAEDGAKLVELTPKEVLNFRENQPGLKIVPVVYYYPQVIQRRIESRAAAASSAKLRLRLVSSTDGAPVSGALVVAITDLHAWTGAEGRSNSKGFVDLALGGMRKKLAKLLVYPAQGFWSSVDKNVTVKSGDNVELLPIDLSFKDALRHFYGNSPDNAGEHVRVAVLDTGVDLNSPDLKVLGGENTVLGEEPSDYGDNGEGHGTHVAGIISARGKPPSGIRGLAPAAELYSYRIFAKNSVEADSFAIAKAIDQAVANGCDLINMSFGGGPPDETVRAAMDEASTRGSLTLIAAGNEDRSPVCFPASFSPPGIAISAMGRKGTFPNNTSASDSVMHPYGKDKKNFVASFSNIGREIDLTGTGAGIISTVPGGYGVMDGTSMATPAVTGFAARLLAGRKDILDMPRDASRTNAMTQLLFARAKLLGFGPFFEGHGLPL